MTVSTFEMDFTAPAAAPAAHTRFAGPSRPRRAKTAPFVPGSETSRAAAESVAPKLSDQEARVMGFLRERGGLTDGELQEALRGVMLDSSVRRARIGLRDAGRVRDSGRKRVSKWGRDVTVWEAVPGEFPGVAFNSVMFSDVDAEVRT